MLAPALLRTPFLSDPRKFIAPSIATDPSYRITTPLASVGATIERSAISLVKNATNGAIHSVKLRIEIGGPILTWNKERGNWDIDFLTAPIAEPELAECAAPAENIKLLEKTFIQDLRWIKGSLNLGMTEIASLFGVTRKAVYDWFDGALPKREGRIVKIHAIRETLQDLVKPEDLGWLTEVWQTQIGNDDSLFNILKNFQGNASALKSVVAKKIDSLGPELNNVRTKSRQSDPYQLGQAHTEQFIRSL